MSVDKRHSSAIQRNRIDRLLVIASLYNGRGESGIAPTPGGAAGAPNTTALAESTDHRPSSQDTTQIASGQDTHVAVGGQTRIHTGQAIGILAGAIQPGAEAAGKGLTLIAAQGPIDLQAQAGPAQIAAKQTLELKTASGVVNIAAAKRIVLAVSGGASITIEGGQFTAQCPGKITVKAGQKAT